MCISKNTYKPTVPNLVISKHVFQYTIRINLRIDGKELKFLQHNKIFNDIYYLAYYVLYVCDAGFNYTKIACIFKSVNISFHRNISCKNRS